MRLPRPGLLVGLLLLATVGWAGVDVTPAAGPAVEAPRPVDQVGQRCVRTDGVWEPGLFTYYLVRGLEEAADTNADQVVTLQELYRYVEQEVTRHARTIGANQHPTMKGELEGLLPLVRTRW